MPYTGHFDHHVRITRDFHATERDSHALSCCYDVLEANNRGVALNAAAALPPPRPLVGVRRVPGSLHVPRMRYRHETTCTVCGDFFAPIRSDARYCSPLCRKAGSRRGDAQKRRLEDIETRLFLARKMAALWTRRAERHLEEKLSQIARARPNCDD